MQFTRILLNGRILRYGKANYALYSVTSWRLLPSSLLVTIRKLIVPAKTLQIVFLLSGQRSPTRYSFCYNGFMKKIAILFNPSSGKKRVKKNLIAIEAAFKNQSLNYELFITESEDHLRELSRISPQNFDIIVGAGGDTTMNIIAEEMTAYYTSTCNLPPMGMVGTGSANDVINSLNLRTPAELAKAISDSSIKNLDVCKLDLNGGEKFLHFIGSMSLGLGVVVNEFVEEFKTKQRLIASNDFTGQVLPGMVGAYKGFKSGKLPQKAIVNGEESVFSLMVLMNTPLYANGLRLSNEVDPFDGIADLMVINTKSVTETTKKMIQISKGKQPAGLIHKKHKEYIIEFPTPTSIQLDGDIHTNIRTIKATVISGILPVFTGTTNKHK